jgi:hypothetical protein
MTARVRPGFRRFAIVAFVILLPLAAHALWDYVEVRRLIREIAAIRNRGEPIAERDLGPTAPVTAEQKLASRLYLAAAALALDGGTDSTLARDLQTASPQLRASSAERDALMRRLEAVLSAHARTFALLDDATRLDFSALAPGTDHSYRTSSLGSLGRLNLLRSAHSCLTGRADDAAEQLLATVRLRRVLTTRLLWTHPNVVGVGFLLSHCAPSAAVLTRVQQAIDASDVSAALSRDLMAERVIFIRQFWRYYGVDASSPENFHFRFWSPLQAATRPWLTHQLVSELRLRAQLIHAAKQPWRQRQDILGSIVRQAPGPARPLQRPAAGLSAAVLMDTDIPMTDERVAFTSASRVALAIERYRREHQQTLPSTLADLVPAFLDEVPADPYADATLLYKEAADGYTIYSVGRNKTDEGGNLTPGKPRWPPQGLISNAPDLGIYVHTVH